MSRKRALCRIPSQGKIAGVCAGIAEQMGIEVWLVRVIVVSGVFLGFFGFIFFLYIVAWAVLDKCPEKRDEGVAVKSKIWQSGETPRRALSDIRQRFADIESRVRRMEQHVTSPAFHLKREIDRL